MTVFFHQWNCLKTFIIILYTVLSIKEPYWFDWTDNPEAKEVPETITKTKKVRFLKETNYTHIQKI